jgi:hypothetical protein
VPKCESFDLFDFNDFYVMKSLNVEDFRDEIKNVYYLNLGQMCIILSLLGYAQCTLLMIFYFELSQNKKLFRGPNECVKMTFLSFHFFH